MELSTYIEALRHRTPATKALPAHANSLAFAQLLDSQDSQKHLRHEFIIPSKSSFKKAALDGVIPDEEDTSDQCVYMVAHGQGLQPKAVSKYIAAQLETWACTGVRGHFTELANSPLKPWQDMAEDCAKGLSGIVGAQPNEVTVMNGLSVNLHLMMASFYKPTIKRHKILTELGPFPSDQYVVESQVRWHGLYAPEESIVTIRPSNNGSAVICTEHILRAIDQHADQTALLLLPGIHYYTGQLFDIAAITGHAKRYGIIVGWDLAHAVGNVELQLHEWRVDFAVWCHYKYINCGPGSIAGAFVHSSHCEGNVRDKGTAKTAPLLRLAGWYGSKPETRYNRDMQNFIPIEGAAGFQVSNPSAMDLSILSAAVSIFSLTSMHELRSKCLALTSYAEFLLDGIIAELELQSPTEQPPFTFVSPRDPVQRGAQLSLEIREQSAIDHIMETFAENGIICDVRKSGLLRLTPTSMYTRFEDVWLFAKALRQALRMPESMTTAPNSGCELLR